jgi:hypothetical protein
MATPRRSQTTVNEHTSLTEAVRMTVTEGLSLSTLNGRSDAALIASAYRVAAQIDRVLDDPDATSTDVSKAMYLVPHLMTTLTAMLATPAARLAAEAKAKTPRGAGKGGKLATLRDAAS